MSHPSPVSLVRSHVSIKVVLSYVLDWILLIIFAIVAGVLGLIEPNKRPFSLVDPDISFPYTEHETVPTWLLILLSVIIPIVVIAVVALVFVPGATVPRSTPASLVWKRKLWELHAGWIGLALSLVSAWFFTNGTKNMCGKPRPDLLDRCQPDLARAAEFVVGGLTRTMSTGQLYSAAVCRQTNSGKLHDGFRSYPSGHSSSSAAGLIYLSLFLASKFAVVIPFAAADGSSASALAHSAFPSRPESGIDGQGDRSERVSPMAAKLPNADATHNTQLQSLRRQAAAPPIYLLFTILTPFCVSIFIAASRWFDFRHHGFDILFGYLIGVATAFYSFRYYHLPIAQGAGWAWGPRSRDRAFWAGVGRLGYVGEKRGSASRLGNHDGAEYPATGVTPVGAGALAHRNGASGAPPLRDVEFESTEPVV